MSDTNKEIAVARVSRTGALIPLNEKNRRILDQPGVVETRAKRNEDGDYVEVGGAENAEVIAASMDLQRIGEALIDGQNARQTLITAALKLPNAADYLQSLGVYDGEEDSQYIDPDSLSPNNAGLHGEEISVTKLDGAPPPPDDPKEDKPTTKSDADKPASKRSSKASAKELEDL